MSHLESVPDGNSTDSDFNAVPASLDGVVEALIFASDQPISAGEISEIYSSVTDIPLGSNDIVVQSIARLNETYERAGLTLRIKHWAGGYKIVTDSWVAPFFRKLFTVQSQKKLSRSLMETLAVLAYRQPVTKTQIDYIRGVDSDYAVKKLLELGLIDVTGRSDAIGRPLLYGTTSYFLEQFGLASLRELPDLKEIEELLNDPSFSREKARLLSLSMNEPGPIEGPVEMPGGDGSV